MGGVAGVSTTTVLGQSGDATVSSHGLSRPTPMLGSVYDILCFYNIKTYIRIMYPTCIYIIKKNTNGLWCRPDSVLPEKVLGQPEKF